MFSYYEAFASEPQESLEICFCCLHSVTEDKKGAFFLKTLFLSYQDDNGLDEVQIVLNDRDDAMLVPQQQPQQLG